MTSLGGAHAPLRCLPIGCGRPHLMARAATAADRNRAANGASIQLYGPSGSTTNAPVRSGVPRHWLCCPLGLRSNPTRFDRLHHVQFLPTRMAGCGFNLEANDLDRSSKSLNALRYRKKRPIPWAGVGAVVLVSGNGSGEGFSRKMSLSCALKHACCIELPRELHGLSTIREISRRRASLPRL